MNSPFQFTFGGKPLSLEDITPERLFAGVQLVKIHGQIRFADPNLSGIENYAPPVGIREDLREPATQFLDQTKPPQALFVDVAPVYSIVAGEIDALFLYVSILTPSDVISHPLPAVARARTLAAITDRFNRHRAERLPSANPRFEVRRFEVTSIDLEPHWSAEHLARIDAFKEAWTEDFRQTFISLLKVTEQMPQSNE
jgi:hypothetical protein